VVYKKLKGERPTLEDLSELDPQLASNLAKMRDFDGDIEATFGAVFQGSFEVYGEVQTFDLMPNGGHVPVTNANVGDYVDKYVQWVLVESVAEQFESFRKGFNRVCGGEALEMFRPSELELLVCGNPVLDFEALESVTHYDDGFEASSPAVQHFWKVHVLLMLCTYSRNGILPIVRAFYHSFLKHLRLHFFPSYVGRACLRRG